MNTENLTELATKNLNHYSREQDFFIEQAQNALDSINFWLEFERLIFDISTIDLLKGLSFAEFVIKICYPCNPRIITDKDTYRGYSMWVIRRFIYERDKNE